MLPFFIFAALPFFIFAAFLLISVGIAQGCDKCQSEDKAQYEDFNPRVKLVQEVHHKESTPLQTTDLAVTVGKKPEKAAVSGHDLGETTSVHSVMVKKLYYCRENQPVDEARRIMREHDLPYLPVVDSNLRVVGTVTWWALYMNPPDNALVLSMDEKSQIQALERSQPMLPIYFAHNWLES